MKVRYLRSNEKKNSGKELKRLRFAERKQRINSFKIKCKMINGNLIT